MGRVQDHAKLRSVKAVPQAVKGRLKLRNVPIMPSAVQKVNVDRLKTPKRSLWGSQEQPHEDNFKQLSQYILKANEGPSDVLVAKDL